MPVLLYFFFLMILRPPNSALFPYTTLFRPRPSSLPLICICTTRCSSSPARSEEHTSELQSHSDLVCRLLLEKKKRARGNPARPLHRHHDHQRGLAARGA